MENEPGGINTRSLLVKKDDRQRYTYKVPVEEADRG